MRNSRRVGRFFVGSRFLDLENIAARRLMEKVLIIEANRQWHRDGVEYLAFCEDFERCPEGMIPPEYTVEIHGNPAQIRFVAIV